MGKLLKLQPPPGVFKNGTPYEAKGRWSDCNLVRWKDGRLQPLGGWETVIGSTITGIGRAMITWRDFTGARWLAIGTNSNLYIFTSLSGTASDITPEAATSTTDLVVGNSDGEIGLGFGTGDFSGVVTRATVTGTDISFTAPATISSTSTVFTDATTTPVGPSPFAVGDEIEISGSSESANNKIYPLSHRVVTAVTAGVAGLSDTTPTPSGAWQASQSHTNVSQTSTSGSGTGIKFSITTDGSGNPTVTITTIGSGYAASNTIVITDPGSTTNTATVTVGSIKNQMTVGLTNGSVIYTGTITGLTITTAGTGYSAGTLSATGGGGSGFAGTYTVTGGVVSTVTITNAGSGYTSTPTIVISDAGNSNAVITADPTGSIATDSSTGESVTIKRARRFGNENSANSSLVLEASSWVFDLWGENLIGLSTSDGKIYEWDPTTTNPTGTKAAVVSNAPINNSSILVSKERHLFALGAGGNNRKIQWSHKESSTTWGATSTNLAGAFEVDTFGKILAGKTVGDRIIIWTTTDVHAIDWVGAPYVYGRKKIGDSCGAISNRSMIAVGDQAFWMSQGGFFKYQGSVQPLNCDVQDHVFKELNRVQDSKIYASVNPEFFEVTWWYASSTSDEILKYVTYNYAENWWSIGELCRTAFAVGSPGVFDNPIGIADDGTVYEHEIPALTTARTTQQVAQSSSSLSDYERVLVNGTDSTTDVGLCYAETGAMEIENGENITNITQLITDSTQGTNGLRFKFKTSYTPNGQESSSNNYDVTSDGYIDVREQGRQFKYRVESPFDQDWEIGTIRADIAPGGRR